MAKKQGPGNKTLQVPATLDGFSFHKDGGASLRFVTNEISIEDVAVIKEFYNTFGWVLFKASEYAPDEIPTEDPDLEGKTPSERLRNALYVLYSQYKETGRLPQDAVFEVWRAQQMEKFIEHVKGKFPKPALPRN